MERLTSVTVTPAYGRDYPTGDDARADWNDNLDFTIQMLYPPVPSGMYLNRHQVRQYAHRNGCEVRIRFNNKLLLVEFTEYPYPVKPI